DGKNDVELEEGFGDRQATEGGEWGPAVRMVCGRVCALRSSRARLSQLPGSGLSLELGHWIATEQPGAIAGDTDRHHLILLRIERGDNRSRRVQGDLVLARSATKDHAYPQLCHLSLLQVMSVSRETRSRWLGS